MYSLETQTGFPLPFFRPFRPHCLSQTESPTQCPTGCRFLGSCVAWSPSRKPGAFRACSQFRPRPNKSSSSALKRNDSYSSASSYFCSGYMVSFLILQAERNMTEVPEAAVVYFTLTNTISDVSTVRKASLPRHTVPHPLQVAPLCRGLSVIPQHL